MWRHGNHAVWAAADEVWQMRKAVMDEVAAKVPQTNLVYCALGKDEFESLISDELTYSRRTSFAKPRRGKRMPIITT